MHIINMCLILFLLYSLRRTRRQLRSEITSIKVQVIELLGRDARETMRERDAEKSELDEPAS
jgi:hypothetical protein